MTTDWTRFKLSIPINAAASGIYDAIATSAGIERWFLASAEFTTPEGAVRDGHDHIAPGDAYLWKWYGFPGGSPETGRIVDANGKDRVSFTFSADCIVTISVKGADGVNIIELVQQDIPPDEKLDIYLGCSTGWLFYLTNLKSILEGGIDLRNKDENIVGVINA